jgi:hypothetical protein
MDNKYVVCIDEGGFEDMLTEGNYYRVLHQENNGYLLTGDDGIVRWFGDVKFK